MKNEDREITSNIVASEKYFDRIVQNDFTYDNNRKTRKNHKNMKLNLLYIFLFNQINIIHLIKIKPRKN